VTIVLIRVRDVRSAEFERRKGSVRESSQVDDLSQQRYYVVRASMALD
jgi:hypothetical protein